jgi:hypothetical protein
MPELGEHYRFRGELIERLEKDVLGPVGGPEEVLLDAPATAYITGVLYPRYPARKDRRPDRNDDATLMALELDDDPAPATLMVDEQPDTGVSLANVQAPSAMGITFSVDPDAAPTVLVEADMAVYDAIDENDEIVIARRAESRSMEDEKLRWRRRPVAIEPVTIDVTVPGSEKIQRPDFPIGLELRARVRRPDDGTVTVTVTLVNVKEAAHDALRDAHCFFQPKLYITGIGGTTAFVERPALQGAGDDEGMVSRLLHRHAPMFATGHGCSADWTWHPPAPRGPRPLGPARTNAVWTTFVPRYDVLLTDSNPDVEELGMLWLATAHQSEMVDSLTRLVTGYRDWIAERRRDAAALDGDYKATADRQLQACEQACGRMKNGISLLERDPVVREAFRLANDAMGAQRARTVWIRGARDAEPQIGDGKWRPFQIGFLLLCLDGIADSGHADRQIADLLWFPTGGGKTEAYLGLIAFTIFHRRLSEGTVKGGGVTVLMRYTLRLLTLQQFERAATLMCAMEVMRQRDRGKLGDERISIGMWVGRAATPNWLKDAAESIEDLRNGKKLQEQNPVQLRSCPWCGTPMDADDYHVDLDAETMSIECRNVECAFSGGLPVHVVDEAIYKARPSLIIATSDKFAQIAWREQVASLFNLADAPIGTPPPELIIQDELHLISGPLGTLAGLYETAIDIAARNVQEKPPKVIASTATIRRAEEQGLRLFDRTIKQFPPAGLDARDSWFAVEAPRESKASRTYLGLLTPSTSQATLLIRAYAALLHHAARIEGDDAVRDAYWTLVGYFNSLRLLAAAELQVHADVDERLKQLGARDQSVRTVEVYRELTSRVDSSDIPKHLEELFIARPDPAAIDVVLATNMISVGVDVDRLGLMAVMGQPQTTAEYIQATSRIGRRHPGLAVMLFNSARSRDRSHYEDFVSYHSALYRQVESTSVTPFAARARDRALHAALVGLVRLRVPDARENDDARRIEDFIDEVRERRDEILARVEKVAPAEMVRAEEELDAFIAHWRNLAEDNPRLVYEARRKRYVSDLRKEDESLLAAYGTDEDLVESYDTMWSLRDVDVESDLYLEK